MLSSLLLARVLPISLLLLHGPVVSGRDFAVPGGVDGGRGRRVLRRWLERGPVEVELERGTWGMAVRQQVGRWG